MKKNIPLPEIEDENESFEKSDEYQVQNKLNINKGSKKGHIYGVTLEMNLMECKEFILNLKY